MGTLQYSHIHIQWQIQKLFDNSSPCQWWIQDFPGSGHQPRGGGAYLLFGTIYIENCIKMKKIRLRVSLTTPY